MVEYIMKKEICGTFHAKGGTGGHPARKWVVNSMILPGEITPHSHWLGPCLAVVERNKIPFPCR
jgi:hypothetical protein